AVFLTPASLFAIAVEFPVTTRKWYPWKGDDSFSALREVARLWAYWPIGSSPARFISLRSFAFVSARQTSIAVVSFSPTVRNRISSVPESESKYHAAVFVFVLETSGIGKGQFSAPMYSTVLPSGSRTRRCIS